MEVTFDSIQRAVAEHYDIRLADVTSKRRPRSVALPRQVAMYLVRHLMNETYPRIGSAFGGKDHTTVMHAVRKIEELKAADRTLAEDIELLKRMLET